MQRFLLGSTVIETIAVYKRLPEHNLLLQSTDAKYCHNIFFSYLKITALNLDVTTAMCAPYISLSILMHVFSNPIQQSLWIQAVCDSVSSSRHVAFVVVVIVVVRVTTLVYHKVCWAHVN